MTDYKELSNVELVSLLRTSDHNAFNEIVKRYSALLINFAYRRVADLPSAEDIVNDAWTDLWKKRLDLSIYNGLEPLIFTSVRTRILDYHKRQKISQKTINDFGDFLSRAYNKKDHVVRNDLLTLIELEIAALPENTRKVFERSRKTHMNMRGKSFV